MERRRPNILFLHAHDMGRYCAPYGHALPTPNMQALAEGGLLFRNAHSAAPTCSPSRAALLTGVTAHQAGVYGLIHRGFDLHDERLHMAAHFRDHGYETVLCGIQHEMTDEKAVSIYDHRFQDAYYNGADRDELVAAAAGEWIKSGHGRPWFQWVGLFHPHRSFRSPDDTTPSPHYLRVPDTLPDNAETRRDMADYHTSVAHADDVFGRILRALDESGQADNTIVILTTDHGIAFPEMKCRLTSHGTGVTLIMRYPKAVGVGRCSDALVSQLDLYPTLCELAGVPTPGHLLGKSLTPLLETGGGEVREDLFAEVNFHAAAEPMRGVRTREYAYIKLLGPDRRSPPANVDNGYSKSFLTDNRGLMRTPDRVQLYDLLLDPMEFRNVAQDPAYAAVMADMEARLLRWQQETEDPALNGSLPVPAEARWNKPDASDCDDVPLIHARDCGSGTHFQL